MTTRSTTAAAERSALPPASSATPRTPTRNSRPYEPKTRSSASRAAPDAENIRPVTQSAPQKKKLDFTPSKTDPTRSAQEE